MNEALSVLQNPAPWLNAGPLGVLLFVLVCAMALVVAPVVGVAIWAFRRLINAVLDTVVSELQASRKEGARTRRAIAALAGRIDSLVSYLSHDDDPARPSSNGRSHPVPKPEKGTPPCQS